MPMLWRMQLNKRKKFLVMLMFGVGGFVTIVSILRLQVLIEFGDAANLTCKSTPRSWPACTKLIERRALHFRGILVDDRASRICRLRLHAFYTQPHPAISTQAYGFDI